MAIADSVSLKRLTRGEMDLLLKQPNGPHLLMEYCREGLVDPEEAAKAIDRFQHTPRQLVRRFLLAIIWSVLGK